MSRMVVMMYHALYADEEELQKIPRAERPYAVSLRNFELQLDALAEDGIPIIDPCLLTGNSPPGHGVVLTFDDGHRSSYQHGFPALARRAWAAAFFVTTDFIEGRDDCCDWTDLREMADNGMLIGAHGRSHRFFDDLDQATASAEFADSKSIIEQRLGLEVTQMSFPGGRLTRGLVSLGMSRGYRLFHSSRVGSRFPGSLNVGAVLPRIAVRGNMRLDHFRQLAQGRGLALLKLQAVAGAKHLARQLAGNRLYQALYESRST